MILHLKRIIQASQFETGNILWFPVLKVDALLTHPSTPKCARFEKNPNETEKVQKCLTTSHRALSRRAFLLFAVTLKSKVVTVDAEGKSEQTWSSAR